MKAIAVKRQAGYSRLGIIALICFIAIIASLYIPTSYASVYVPVNFSIDEPKRSPMLDSKHIFVNNLSPSEHVGILSQGNNIYSSRQIFMETPDSVWHGNAFPFSISQRESAYVVMYNLKPYFNILCHGLTGISYVNFNSQRIPFHRPHIASNNAYICSQFVSGTFPCMNFLAYSDQHEQPSKDSKEPIREFRVPYPLHKPIPPAILASLAFIFCILGYFTQFSGYNNIDRRRKIYGYFLLVCGRFLIFCGIIGFVLGWGMFVAWNSSVL